MSNVRVGPIDIHRKGSPLHITSESVHYLYRRVVHKNKQISLLKIMFLIRGLGKCEGVGEDSGDELIR